MWESKESAEQVRLAKMERQKALEELHREKEMLDEEIGGHTNELDQVLAVMGIRDGIEDIDPTIDQDAPRTLDKARKSVDWPRWEASYHDELNSLKEMGMWELTPQENILEGQKVFKGRPVFTIKQDKQGKITCFKTQHVLQGFTMVQEQDYNKSSSSTAHAELWHILLHFAATLGWDATQIDVKMAFLNGVLPKEEQIFMQQPKGFEEKEKESWVYKLL